MRSTVRLGRRVLAFVAFCATLELLARIDDHYAYGAPIAGRYDAEMLYTRDSLGRRGKPHARYRKWQLNEAGYRGPALRIGRTTIVTFGASETFGLYEAEGREYPRELERLLNARAGADRFQVVNAAYPGESAHTAAMRLPEIAEQVKPRIAIVYAVPADYIWLPYLTPNPDAQPNAEPGFEPRLTERVRTFLKGMLPKAVQTKLRQRDIDNALQGYAPMKRLPEENVRRFRADVTQLVRTTKSVGALPVVVTHVSAFGPTLTAEDRDLLTSWRRFYPMLAEDGLLDMERRMNDALRAIAAEEGVPLIDAARLVPPDRKYFADFVHFTDAGATLMAETVAAGIAPLLQQTPAADSLGATGATSHFQARREPAAPQVTSTRTELVAK